MKKYGLLSVLFFLAAFSIYIISMFITGDLFSGKVMIMIVIVLPMIGLKLGLKAKGGFKTFGIIGNSFILLISVVVPLVSIFFWNQP
ncbi:hypothetical protein ACIGEL_06275 [Rossellomorea aquimaris]|uniref:hypothetical protein n=1 Tax=Rossellomorea aquimaris TaxID=189382 RepID=UPI0037C61D74